jgi:FKBP-type peptidyl-prolyl cis-trans isomerase/DnaJ domain
VTTERDYYSTLQLNRAASDDDIDAAYERLSRLYNPAVSKKPRAETRWQQISEAYETLSDPQARAAYDRKLSRMHSARGGGIELPAWVTSPYAVAGAAVGFTVGFLIVLIVISVFFENGPEAAVSEPTVTIPASSPSVTPPLPAQSPIEPPANPPAVSGETITTPSGLQYIDLQPGTGATPVAGQTVVANYTGWLAENGQLFDSSLSRDTPFAFPLGQGAVIPGWDEAFAAMQVGAKRRLIIPAALAYGAEGREGIPPNATLIFDVELLEAR